MNYYKLQWVTTTNIMSDYEENEDIHIDGSHGASHMEEEKE